MASKDDLLQHLRELPDTSFAALYENIWAVVAVLRSLPQLARQVLSREVEDGIEGSGWGWGGACGWEMIQQSLQVGARRQRWSSDSVVGSFGEGVMIDRVNSGSLHRVLGSHPGGRGWPGLCEPARA